jgi:TolB-like protein/DNA-binding winged helix-turn-helix (wHTH) protein
MAIHALGPFRLDTQAHLLLRNSAPVALGRRAIALLRTLVEQPGTLVSKDALIEAAWSGRAVEESNLPVQIAALRRVLGEAPGGDRWIETMPGRGYRFIGPVITEAQNGVVVPPQVDAAWDPERRQITTKAGDGQVVLGAATGQPEPAAPGAAIAIAETVPDAVRLSPLPDKPSIAVLPFQNMSGDPEQEYFVDGTVEEIITALSRIRWLFVLARNSSFTYKGQAVDVKQVGRELGVHYVLEGSVRKAGARVRITGQLIDAITGAHLWADRFDGSLEDVFDLQDKVASSVAGVIEPALQAAETARSTSRPTNDLTAYDLYLRAYAMILSSRQFAEALRLMEQAIACDPCFGLALAWAAVCCSVLLREDRTDDRAGDRLKGADFARRALEVAGDDPGVLAHAAQALTYFGEDIGAMMALVDRALALNPNYARGWHISGILRMNAGQPDIAIAHAEAAMRLSPRARIGTTYAVIGQSHFLSRRFDKAVPKLLLAIQDDPSYPVPYRALAACYAHMGRLGDAQELVRRLRAISSVVIPDDSYLRNPEHRELYLSGLRLAAGKTA